MSSEVHKYIEKALEKNQNLFDTELINFPKNKKPQEIKAFKQDILKTVLFLLFGLLKSK